MFISAILKYLPIHEEDALTITEIAIKYLNDVGGHEKSKNATRNTIRNIERSFKNHAQDFNIINLEGQRANRWYWDIERFTGNRLENLDVRIKRNLGENLEKILFPKPSIVDLACSDLINSNLNSYDINQALNFWLNRIFYIESTLRFRPVMYNNDTLKKITKSINRNKIVSFDVLTRRSGGNIRRFENVQFIAVLQHGVNTDFIFIMNGNISEKYRVQLHRINNITEHNEGKYIEFDFQAWVNATGGLFNDLAEAGLSNYVNFEDPGRIFKPERVEFTAYIHSDLYEELIYTKIEDSQEITSIPECYSDDNLPWYLLKLNTIWSEQLTWWIMSWGMRIIVITPDGLKELIKDRLRKASDNYN